MRRPYAIFLSLLLALSLVLAACGNDDEAEPTPTPAPPAPTPSPVATPDVAAGTGPLYLALGDSLSAGIGATDFAERGFVGLVHRGLGGDWELKNLGVPGHTSDDLLGVPMAEAIAEIERREADPVEGNEVGVITLEIGGNDLLGLFNRLVMTGRCPSVTESLERPECVDALRNALDNFGPNLREALDRLQDAAPDTPIFLMTLYNPFTGRGTNLEELGIVSIEGMEGTPFPEGINDIIRAQAEESGVHLVEIYPLFDGNPQYISMDLIHPNDEGYQVMADAVLQAMTEAGITDGD